MNTKLTPKKLLNEISQLIEKSKAYVAQKVNSTLVVLYWQIGDIINSEILKAKRAGYGQKIIKQLAATLQHQYGQGFNERALFRMVRFSKQFPEKEIVATLSPLLSWSHFIELIAFDDILKCQFYTEMCRLKQVQNDMVRIISEIGTPAKFPNPEKNH